MPPLFAVALVLGLNIPVWVLTLRLRQIGFWQHLAMCVFCGVVVWVFNLFMLPAGGLPEDTLWNSLWLLMLIGLGLGLASALALFVRQWLRLLQDFWEAPYVQDISPQDEDNFNRFEISQDGLTFRTTPRPRRKSSRRLPAPEAERRLVWCRYCKRWSSATAVHEHVR